MASSSGVGTSLPITAGGLKQPFGLWGEAVDARGQDGPDGGGHCQLLDGPGKPIGAAPALERARLDKGPHTLLKKEGIGIRPLDQEPLKRGERCLKPKERIEQLVGALGRQGIDPELAIVGLAAPAVAVFRAVVEEEQEPH
jgi:hypothetical protein